MGARTEETTKATDQKQPNDFVLLRRIERDVAQLSEAGLAYLRTMLGLGPKSKEG